VSVAGLDAVVIGSGPNGLTAAATIASAGRSVEVFEAAPDPGGGARTAELAESGFRHDTCSAIHPMGITSPAFRSLGLDGHGLRWIHPESPLAHPLDDRTVLLERSVTATAEGLGDDRAAWERLLGPLADDVDALTDEVLAGVHVPRHPRVLARFARHGLSSATAVGRRLLVTADARALLAGLAAHSVLPLDRPLTAGVGLLLGAVGHAAGWPMAAGGSQAITDALIDVLVGHGGVVHCNRPVHSLDGLPPARVVLADVSPPALARIAGDRLPARYRRRLDRYRYGPAAFKVDYALAEAVPWRDPATARAATVHVGGTMDEIATAEVAPWQGRHADRPFVLVAQPSLFDASRAPAGRHTLWAYCHVPPGSAVDMTTAIEQQLERFAPGFRDVVIARRVTTPADFEVSNANDVGGDITGGVTDWRQLLARPVARLHPWRTPMPGLYLCSASTPPGAGVHGLCGWYAARLALRRELRD
jgi:phytoene dehydrogenase-like protein